LGKRLQTIENPQSYEQQNYYTGLWLTVTSQMDPFSVG